MKALALVVALAVGAAHSDEPKRVALAPLVLEVGTPAPVKGVLVPEEQAIALAKAIKACEAERDVLRKTPAEVPWGVVVAVAVGGLVVGASGGAYVTWRVTRP